MGYKLLTQDMKTRKGKYNEMDWSDVGEWHVAAGEGGLCTEGALHDYDDPWIAAVMNPAHAAIHDPVMYETERGGAVVTDGLKCGCKRLRLVRRMDIPDVPLIQRVAFAILAAMQVCRDGVWLTWARAWLSGEDRSSPAAARADANADADAVAYAAATAAAYAADAVAYAVARAAAYADANAARDAAYAAANAARAAAAYAAARDAAYAAAAYAAARDAAYAAARDAAYAGTIDWQAIKTKAMQIK